MRIAVFCSANEAIDERYFQLTEELGEWLGTGGFTLVYGGCDMGLMRAIGQSVHRYGGRTIGIVPRIIERGGRVADCLDVEIPVDNLSERKDLMLAKSDIVIALPGGIGTLDEIFTVAAAHTIGYHDKRVILYNMHGFWDAALSMLDDMQARGMIRGRVSDFFDIASSLEEVKAIIMKQKL
ncbi:MAG: TIGR00730 family Rossman fold protein [Prevotella sp.]|nr:TIGR00730 family Rossman fold protein [Prevotella sp.]